MTHCHLHVIFDRTNLVQAQQVRCMSNKLILACSECGSRNYSVPNNRSGKQDRLELKKFCTTCNAHTVHRETK